MKEEEVSELNVSYRYSVRLINELTNSLVAEPEGSTPLIPEPATGHDPEPGPSTCHAHKLFLCIPF
jgi:hypothetical protein